jgi:hypothetical protein
MQSKSGSQSRCCEVTVTKFMFVKFVPSVICIVYWYQERQKLPGLMCWMYVIFSSSRLSEDDILVPKHAAVWISSPNFILLFLFYRVVSLVDKSMIHKSKRIPSIFNDESTGSFIYFAYSAFLCFLTSSMSVSGSLVLYTITPQSGIDHDIVSVVKILLKAFLFSSIFPYPPPPLPTIRAPCASSYSAFPHSFLQQATSNI